MLYHSAPALDLYVGDALAVLRTLPAGLAHSCVTSPPYFGLRDYAVEPTSWPDVSYSTLGGTVEVPAAVVALGHEDRPEAFVGHLLAVLREVRRVLRSDGTLWLNLGDSYAADRSYQVPDGKWVDVGNSKGSRVPAGLKQKDLVGIPWMVAFALRADGWYLRAENIWAKPNPMPESVLDRPTRAHEQVFLLAPSARYFYDGDAILEPAVQGELYHGAYDKRPGATSERNGRDAEGVNFTATRNARSVWTITTQPYAGEHYAAFPEELARRCILAGTSEHGVCANCAAPYRRLVEKGEPELAANTWSTTGAAAFDGEGYAERSTLKRVRDHSTVGWEPTCSCGAGVAPAVVLDPFLGSGTTALVAREHGRRTVGIDLNPDFAEQAVRRALGAQTRELESDRRPARDGTLSLFG